MIEKKLLKITWFLVLTMVLSFNASAQVQILTNLSNATSDVCLNRNKNLSVGVRQGSCSPFAGNLNSAMFTWQIESAPGVWIDINSFPVTGISYTTNKTFNTAQTQITERLTVSFGWNTQEGVYKYRALVQGSGGCAVATTLTESIAIQPNKWIGGVNDDWDNSTNWSCGRVPSINERAVILGTNPCVISRNNSIKALEVVNGASLTVNSGFNFTVNGIVNVTGTGNFTLQNNANLIQTSYDGSNIGNANIKRNSSALMRLDYTMWSSPVSGQNLLSFSPLTLTNRFYEYNSDSNLYASIDPSATNFQTGKGYLIRMPNNHPTTATVWNGSFTGVPNNGNIALNLYNGGAGKRFNAIGNPYPSPIRMSSFVSTNTGKITGTLYFWRKSNNAATEPGYCTWTTVGFVSNGEAQVVNPNGIIRTGQGFIVEMLNNETNVNFNNSMRIANAADQFFREVSNEGELIGNKIWLNVNDGVGAKNQMLVGYFNEATLGVDYGIDGKAIEDASVSLTMDIEGEKYLIQGKPAFTASDVVPLRFKTAYSGDHTISIDHLEGVFVGGQNIYLKDNLLNVTHNLKTAAYSFTSNAGTFDTRFEIIYQSSVLGTNQNNFNENTVIVFKDGNGNLNVNANGVLLDNVEVYDVRGRKLIQKSEINGATALLSGLRTENTVLLVKVIAADGAVVNKKIVF